MTYILILGAFAFFAARLFGKGRTITPGAARETLPDQRVPTFLPREPLALARAEQTAPAPVELEMAADPGGYLLGGADTVADMMDMMSGPGLLTRRDP